MQSDAAALHRRGAHGASLAATDYEIAIGQFQILNQNSVNAENEPLKPKASTLSRSDLITF